MSYRLASMLHAVTREECHYEIPNQLHTYTSIIFTLRTSCDHSSRFCSLFATEKLLQNFAIFSCHSSSIRYDFDVHS